MAGKQLLVRVVVALDQANPIGFHDQQVIGHAVDEVTVVTHEQHGSLELSDRLLQRVARPEIEVIGGLVEDEKIGVRGGQARQGGAAPLAAA